MRFQRKYSVLYRPEYTRRFLLLTPDEQKRAAGLEEFVLDVPFAETVTTRYWSDSNGELRAVWGTSYYLLYRVNRPLYQVTFVSIGRWMGPEPKDN